MISHPQPVSYTHLTLADNQAVDEASCGNMVEEKSELFFVGGDLSLIHIFHLRESGNGRGILKPLLLSCRWNPLYAVPS